MARKITKCPNSCSWYVSKLHEIDKKINALLEKRNHYTELMIKNNDRMNKYNKTYYSKKKEALGK